VGKKVHIATIYVRARVSGEKMEVPGEKIKVSGEKIKVPGDCQELPWNREKALYDCHGNTAWQQLTLSIYIVTSTICLPAE
jgi:hypothetical protein